MSSKPPKKKSSFKEFVSKVGNTLASLSPFAPKPAVNCPYAQPPPPEPPKPVERPEPKPLPPRPVKPLPPTPWRLTVIVKCNPVTENPTNPATVSLTGSRSDTVVVAPDEFAGGIGQTKVSKQRKYDISSTGHTDYDVTVDCDGWKMVAARKVSLDDGDKKEVTIEIRKLKWVAFKLVRDIVINKGGKHEKKEEPLAGVQMDITLPEDQKKQDSSLDTEPFLRYEKLEDGTCKITNMSHADVWEFEKLT